MQVEKSLPDAGGGGGSAGSSARPQWEWQGVAKESQGALALPVSPALAALLPWPARLGQ